MLIFRTIAAAIALSPWLASIGISQTAEFVPLGILSGHPEHSTGADISADGRWIIGKSRSDASGWNGGLFEAVRWTDSGAVEGLGFLPGSDRNSRGWAISPDGDWVTAYDTLDSNVMAALWSAQTGMIAIGDLAGGTDRSTATGVSNGGRVVVGYAGSAQAGEFGNEAFRWTPVGGIEGLGFLGPSHDGDYLSHLQDISADGRIAVGGSSSPEHGYAITWSAEDGMQPLPMHEDAILEPSIGGAGARAISNDGRWITGTMTLADLTGDEDYLSEGVLWTPDGEVIRLGQLYDDQFRRNLPLDVSESGTVVGNSNSSHAGTEPFIWDQEHGMRDFVDVLLDDYGIDTLAMGWKLGSLSAITPDGSVIVGHGFNRNEGRTEAFMVRIVPAPTTLAPLAAFGIFVGRRRR